MQREQLRYRLDRNIYDGHATGAIEVQARKKEIEITDSHATRAIDVQAKEKDIKWS